MTVQMKKKPIKEGYKFYALCDASTGFVYCFVPDGLREKKKKKIFEKVLSMAKTLHGRGKRQYVIKMDNYITYSKTMKGLHQLNVAAAGTAQER
jgi:hypothetical protein